MLARAGAANGQVLQSSKLATQMAEAGRIKILIADGEMIGPARLLADTIWIESGGIQRRIPLGNVQKLWVEKKDVRKGALHGMIAGGLFGLGLGLLFDRAVHDPAAESHPPIALIGTASGVGVGALLGAIGSPARIWKSIYP